MLDEVVSMFAEARLDASQSRESGVCQGQGRDGGAWRKAMKMKRSFWRMEDSNHFF